MAWRTRRNENECGIFVMRHMETYNVQKVEEWNLGFRNEDEGQQGQLKTLRRKYAAKMLLSDENIHRKQIISESIKFLSLPAEQKKHRLKPKTEKSSAKRAKLNPEYSILKSSRSESVFKKNEENVKKKLNLNQEQREFDSMPSFDLGFDLPSKQVEEITLCESLEKVNLTTPEEKPNINNVEVVSLLTPPEESQTIVESAEIQASTEEVNAANALFSMRKIQSKF
ncbi:ulp1 protease family, C-terminal catalytic domain-containing protein [Artemisia annua]|uniref:Ulp1 protease family, C-terminal catalytic domain-containing protein n=1 Tax=Artemisia annua TaxID=35608 RepID=A0A2U1KM15_ARTAN|nr:ulp1 protease family, C-terminal catalytic domain-containing protein [Artemisia annua]